MKYISCSIYTLFYIYKLGILLIKTLHSISSKNIQYLYLHLYLYPVSLHKEVMNNFKKTAKNFHYEFNIRHISNVFQGLLVSNPDQFHDPEKFFHLWVHESERVYGDRLVSPEDLVKYNTIVQAQAKKVFPSYNLARFFAAENADPMVFCHFPENIQDKVYDMIASIDKMSHILEDALREYVYT